MAIGVVVIGRLVGKTYGQESDKRGDGIGSRMQRIGNEGQRADHQANRELGGGEAQAGGQRYQRHPFFSGHRNPAFRKQTDMGMPFRRSERKLPR